MTYLDTSVLVAYYCPEPLSPQAQRAVQAEREPAVSALVEVELTAALARKVRVGAMRLQDARLVHGMFQDHLQRGGYRRLTLSPAHFAKAQEWLATFRISLRTLDALDAALAAAEGAMLLTADAALANACAALGANARLLS